MIRLYYAARYLFIFLKALAQANIDVTKRVLSRRLNIRPGFLAVPLDATTDFEITSFANSITLTPGTISVHIDREHRTLVMHALDIGDDPDLLRQDVKQTLEANILKWTRPRTKLSRPER